MTKVLNGYAQPDIEATKNGETIMVFVETPRSLRENARAIGKSLGWIGENEPDTRVDLVCTKPRVVH